ncbi:MAG: translation initiation factor 2 [Gammaproteobacteria bacterium]|nr:translation initiation factor 2 [Gammaproteobacteria bacterium]
MKESPQIMQDDPRRAIVEVMARLGRETQLHVDERHKHFKMTDKVIRYISILLLIVAVVNVSLVWLLSTSLDTIVNNMDSMRSRLVVIDDDMQYISTTVGKFDEHTAYMHTIANNIGSITTNLPLIRLNTDSFTLSMQSIDKEMEAMKNSIGDIDGNMRGITNTMVGLEYNVRQFAKPMGSMNSILP